MDPSPPVIPNLSQVGIIPLTDDQVRRLVQQASLLRGAQNKGKLIVEFDGPIMLLSVSAPAGKVR